MNFNSKKTDSDNWHKILRDSIVTPDQLKEKFQIDTKNIKKVTKHYPMYINSYYMSLIKSIDDPIWKQAVPDIKEIDDNTPFEDDPLHEEKHSPVLNLVHRYPDRVLFLVSNKCAMYCRHCMRKRRVGKICSDKITYNAIKEGIKYISRQKTIRDVILSGGDPLLLEDDILKAILNYIREIPHVEIIRIHTRIPCTLPQRITTNLASILKTFHPLFINIHFNHPDEITCEAKKACAILSDAGIPLGSQTVLLKGVNDSSKVIKKLMQKFLQIRVKPYYLHHADIVKGTCHFRTSIKKGLQIIKSFRGHTSGLCVPHYMIDLPKGGGKIPLLPEYIKFKDNDFIMVESFNGKIYKYPYK